MPHSPHIVFQRCFPLRCIVIRWADGFSHCIFCDQYEGSTVPELLLHNDDDPIDPPSMRSSHALRLPFGLRPFEMALPSPGRLAPKRNVPNSSTVCQLCSTTKSFLLSLSAAVPQVGRCQLAAAPYGGNRSLLTRKDQTIRADQGRRTSRFQVLRTARHD